MALASDELYAAGARPRLPLLPDAVRRAVRKRVAVQVEAELARDGGRTSSRRKREDDVEDRALLGDDCGARVSTTRFRKTSTSIDGAPFSCDAGVTSLKVPSVSCKTMPRSPTSEGFLARLTARGLRCQCHAWRVGHGPHAPLRRQPVKSALTILVCRLATLTCSSRGTAGAPWRAGKVGRSVDVVGPAGVVAAAEDDVIEGGDGDGITRGTASSSDT